MSPLSSQNHIDDSQTSHAHDRGVNYCHTCGRIISPRQSHQKAAKAGTPVKYCSDRCRHNKPGQLDRKIEQNFISLLCDGKTKRKRSKGDPRNIVACSEVEDLVFGHQSTATKKAGSRGKRSEQVEEWKSVDTEDTDVLSTDDSDGGVSLHDHPSHEPGSIDLKRREGQRQAEQRERVKQAARRGCVFGFAFGDGTVQKCEAIANGNIVEPSFAKGDWAIRWTQV